MLAVHDGQGRDLRTEPEADAGDRLLPDRVGGVAPAPVGAGAPGRDRLAGTVEVDETYIGGEETGLRGGRARGKKVLTGMAVEVQETKRLGRCRLQPIVDASAASLHAFVTDHVEPGARVITDGWQGYHGLDIAANAACDWPSAIRHSRSVRGSTTSHHAIGAGPL